MTERIKREYERLRERAEREAQLRKEAAYLRAPELKQIHRQRREALLSLKGANPGPGENGRESVERALELLARREEDILHSLGLDASEFLPRYRCPLCGDTGFVGATLRTPCSCYVALQGAERFLSSNVDCGETFDAFDESIYPDLRQRRLSLAFRDWCEGYADRFPETETLNVLLQGNVGLGKSYLLNSMAHRVCARGFSVRKLTAYNMVRLVLENIREQRGMEELLECSLLCIDDLGTEPMLKNITREYLFLVINERLNANRHTVIATNLSLTQLEELYSERVFSRLISPRVARVLQFEGKDVRLI
ncbi:MAG: ATP-binding protein [Bacillota bacterium]